MANRTKDSELRKIYDWIKAHPNEAFTSHQVAELFDREVEGTGKWISNRVHKAEKGQVDKWFIEGLKFAFNPDGSRRRSTFIYQPNPRGSQPPITMSASTTTDNRAVVQVEEVVTKPKRRTWKELTVTSKGDVLLETSDGKTFLAREV